MKRLRQRIRDWAMRWVKILNRRVPHSRTLGKLGFFGTARRTHLYLSSLCAGRPSVITVEPAKPTSSRVPKKIWFLADLYWEPKDLVPELQKIGDVVVTDLKPAVGRAGSREKVLELVQRTHRDIEPELILLYAKENLLSDALFDLLRTKSAPIWGMNVDDKVDFFPDAIEPYQDRDGYCRWVRHFDINLAGARALVPHYEAHGGRTLFFTPGFHLRPEFNEPRPAIVDPVSFVAAWRESRAEVIEKLKRYGLPIQPYGRGWEGGKFVELPWTVYRSSQISLGDGISPGSYTTNLKPRDFETPGANACYLTTYNWELCDQFEVGKEILLYRNADELVEMLTYYIPRPELCAQIAQAGFERAKRDHTWEHRFRSLFAKAF